MQKKDFLTLKIFFCFWKFFFSKIECNTIEEKQCKTSYEPECETVTKEVCGGDDEIIAKYPDDLENHLSCKNVSRVDCRNVPKQECANIPKQQCINYPTQVGRILLNIQTQIITIETCSVIPNLLLHGPIQSCFFKPNF